MRFGSVCSGIEAASQAWKPLGWEPLFFSEIEKFPSTVLEYRHPEVENLGDMAKFQEWGNYEPDVIVGGTPCQSFSVAGLRKGLDDPRGNLMLTYLAIANRYRPRWLVWENVPGVLSSNKGRDFGTFLGALGQLGYGWSYRALDAQYFGVPQRRRRVFVVGCLGGWQRAAGVLFERHSLQGHSSPSRETGEEVAGTLTRGFGDRGVDSDQIANGNYAIQSVAGCLGTEVPGARQRCDASDNYIICHGTQDPCVSDKAFAIGRNNGGENVLACFKGGQGAKAGGIGYSEHVAPTLSAAEGMNRTPTLLKGMQVRRLTPIECERLMGFPDNYTRIPWRGKPVEECPNGHRYKALGNSMAVPVVRWIGERIDMVELIANIHNPALARVAVQGVVGCQE